MPYIRANLALNNMEVILTAAECYAREGGTENLAEAARLYNLLRDHRIENNVHVTFANADEALVKVLEERRREFAFLGIYRFVDLLIRSLELGKSPSQSACAEAFLVFSVHCTDGSGIYCVVSGRDNLPSYFLY